MKWVSTSEASFWATRTKITAILPSGQEKSYFAKVYHVPRALAIARGEFKSTNHLHAVLSSNVPRAVGYGTCAVDPERAFFIAEFRSMRDELPSADQLVGLVTKIHQVVSPSGKFGYPYTTFTGKHAVENAWSDTWEEFFARVMRDTMQTELGVHGPDPELEELSEKILARVIPRLIRPMETEGRSIKPVLVHGDLWHGNVSVDNETGEPVLYDPCCFYGHYECKCTCVKSTPRIILRMLVTGAVVR
ncbi:fructosamine kinase family protein [Candidatus Bathyarchaeota archaeon]|nr:fructosamine kinase family protein [Candidatus Bathyarchaeota archaeon]